MKVVKISLGSCICVVCYTTIFTNDSFWGVYKVVIESLDICVSLVADK